MSEQLLQTFSPFLLCEKESENDLMLTFKVISTCCNKYKQHITANHYLPNGKTTYAAMMYVL